MTLKSSIQRDKPATRLPKALNIDFSIRIALWVTLIFIGTALITTGWPIGIGLGLLVNGLMFVHGVELQHQCLHNTGFSSKRANRIFGLLLGLPMGVSHMAYRESHLRHHRLLGTPEDKEFFDYTHPEINIVGILKYSFNFKRYPKLFARMKAVLEASYLTGSSHAETVDYVSFLLAVVILASLSFHFGWEIAIFGWLVPNILISEPLHNLIELPEHIQCQRTSKNVLLNTRTIRSNSFMTWFTNSNNFHVEHHRYPGVPMQLMPKVHQDLLPNICFFKEGYFSFFKELLHKGSAATAILDEEGVS